MSLFCYALLCVHSSFAVILKRKRKLGALLILSYRCIVAINVLWLFLMVPWVGLQCVIVVFPDHTHLPFVYVQAVRMYESYVFLRRGTNVVRSILNRLVKCILSVLVKFIFRQ